MSDYTELVKALRCCISKNPPETCVGCTYSKCNNECAVRRMILDAAAAIEALQAEVKRLEPKRGEIVRCRECRWGHLCVMGQHLGLDGFCSKGEREVQDEGAGSL